MSKENQKDDWKIPSEKDDLKEAHDYFNLPKVTRRKKRLDWWDKVKIAIHKKDKTEDADFEIIEPKQISNEQENSTNGVD